MLISLLTAGKRKCQQRNLKSGYPSVRSPVTLSTLQNCCCYKIVVVATKLLLLLQNYCCCYKIVVVTLGTLQNYCHFLVKIAKIA